MRKDTAETAAGRSGGHERRAPSHLPSSHTPQAGTHIVPHVRPGAAAHPGGATDPPAAALRYHAHARAKETKWDRQVKRNFGQVFINIL